MTWLWLENHEEGMRTAAVNVVDGSDLGTYPPGRD